MMKKQFLQNAERNNFISIFITYHNFGPMGQWPSPFFSGLGWAGSGPAHPNPEIFGWSPAHADPKLSAGIPINNESAKK